MSIHVTKDNIEKSVRAVLKEIVGPGLAPNFTFQGNGAGTYSFEKTRMWDVVVGE